MISAIQYMAMELKRYGLPFAAALLNVAAVSIVETEIRPQGVHRSAAEDEPDRHA